MAGDIAQKYRDVEAYIREHGDVKVEELTERFFLSPATVRRVLTAFAREGLIRRYHGGAALIDPESLSLFKRRLITNESAKRAIGRLAASFVRDETTIMMMGGTTVSAMCPFLTHLRLTVITNSLPVVNLLSWYPGIQLVILGGVLNPDEMEMRGALTEHSLARLRADQMFIGATGVHPSHGLMTDDPNAIGAYRQCIASSDALFLLADDSKFVHPHGTGTVATLSEIGHIVTNQPLTPRQNKEYAGVQLHIAANQGG